MPNKVQCTLTNPSKHVPESLKFMRIRKGAARFERILRRPESPLLMTPNEAQELGWFIAERLEKLR